MTEDEVKAVVELIVREEFTDKYDNDEIIQADWIEIRRAIASRVAAKLSTPTAATPLNSDEVAQLRHRLKDWRVTAETSAALVERLLDGATVAPVLSDEERDLLSYLVGWCNSSIGDVRVERNRFERSVAVLDRLLGASR